MHGRGINQPDHSENMLSSTLTILLIGAFLCVIMLLVLSPLLRTGIPGVREWVYANALMVAAFVLYAFGKSLPPIIAYELTNAVNAAASITLLLGFQRFLSRKSPLAVLIVGVTLIPLAIAIFHYAIDSFALRTLTVALFQGIVFIAIAITLLTSAQAERWRYPHLFTAVVAALVAGAHLARGIIFMLAPDAPTSLLQPSPWNLFFLTASTLVMPLMTLGAIMMVHDTMMAESKHAAGHDPLTGAWSRRAFFAHAQRELKRAADSGVSLALLLIDVDHFRAINDRFGLTAGDQVLVDIVSKGKASLRATDCIGRINGNEFAVLLPGTNHQGAFVVAKRLRRKWQAPFLAPAQSGNEAQYTVSMGVVLLQESESFEELLRRADAALHQAKAAGGNQVIGEAEIAPKDVLHIHP